MHPVAIGDVGISLHKRWDLVVGVEWDTERSYRTRRAALGTKMSEGGRERERE